MRSSQQRVQRQCDARHRGQDQQRLPPRVALGTVERLALRLGLAARALQIGRHALAFHAAALRGQLARQALVLVAGLQLQQFGQRRVRFAIAAERGVGGGAGLLEAHPQPQVVGADQRAARVLHRRQAAGCAAVLDQHHHAVHQGLGHRIAGDGAAAHQRDRFEVERHALVGLAAAGHGHRHAGRGGGDAEVIGQRVIARQRALQRIERLGVAAGMRQHHRAPARGVGLA